MLSIKLKDGTIYTGQASDIVVQLKYEDYTSYLSKEQYKSNIKKRVINFFGFTICYSNDLEFLQELDRIGVIELIN